MSNQDWCGFLEVGRAVAVCPLETKIELAGTVADISPEEIVVKLSKPVPEPPLANGLRVLFKYWDEQGLYYLALKVLEASGSKSQVIALSRRGRRLEVQRRKSHRVPASIPFSYLVVTSTKNELTGESVTDAETQDICVGGLKFETHLPLEEGDTLLVTLNLSPSQQVSAHAWVVRRKQIEGQPRYEIGLAFLQLGLEEQVQLLQYVAHFRTGDRRQLPRWEVSIPCTVEWQEYAISGQIANLSFAGALLTGLSAVPPEGVHVAVSFRVKTADVKVGAKVTSRVIHSRPEIIETGQAGSLGVQFEKPEQELMPTLNPILRELFSARI